MDPGASRRARIAFAAGVAVACLGIVWYWKWLAFPLDRDETHFWPTALLFADRLVPTLETLRGYGDLNTPLPFWLWGQLERATGHGLVAGRWLNLAMSLGLVAMVVHARGKASTTSLLAGVGMLASPYFIGLSTHLYTDMTAALFVCAGVLLHLQRRFAWSACAFVLAIATRQYMVAFPAALALDSLARRGPERLPRSAWIWPGIAALSLGGWFLLFGGFAPPGALARQQVSTVSLLRVHPSYGLYALACIGAYYCVPEALLFRRLPRLPVLRVAVPIALGLGVLFLLAPPTGNVEYRPETMGFLDVAARRLPGTAVRMVLYFALALAAALRFHRAGAAGFLVATHCVLLAKAHLAWDKYAVPTVCALWLMRAWQEADANRDHPGSTLATTTSGQ